MTNPGPSFTSNPNWGSVQNAQFLPPGSTQAQINAAIVALSAAGGGILNLGPGTYALTGPIVPANGVQIVGVAPQLNFSGAQIPDSNQVVANGGGTILQGDGTFAAFQWNKAVLGVPASANAFTLSALSGIAIRNLCINNFSRAVDGGNTNNGGAWWSEFNNLYITNCTDWGFYITNFMHCKFNRIYTFACVTGGQFYGNDVPAATLQPGNSTWYDLYNNTPVVNANLSRGVVFNVIQGQQNEGVIQRVQANKNNASVVTQAATMVNASANITVTDGTKFAVGMPVSFSASVNGFTQNQIYFVLSVAANVVTVANTVGGAAINATGNTAINIVTSGFACLEMVAASGAALSSHDMFNIDVENGGTAAIVLQNIQTSRFSVSQVPSTSQCTQAICGRNVTFCQIFTTCAAQTDFDANNTASQFFGMRATGSVQRNLPGLYFDQGSNQTFLNFQGSTLGLTDQTMADGTHLIIPQTGLGLKVNQFSGTTATLQSQNSGLCICTSASAATWTLPGVTTTTVNSTWFKIVNPTANNLTVNTAAAGQTFNNKAGLLSLTVGPNAGCDLVAVRDGNGNNYWAVTGVAGSYAAGTITGL